MELSAINADYNGYLLTTDKKLMKESDIYQWLSEESYWAKHIPYETFKESFDHSFCIGMLIDGRQIAYARLVTDYATFGYLADVFVTEPHRGKGVSKKMMEALFDIDWVKRLRRVMLATIGAQGLYTQYGFTACRFPERIMELTRLDIYKDLIPLEHDQATAVQAVE